jgi:hypothetical protein
MNLDRNWPKNIRAEMAFRGLYPPPGRPLEDDVEIQAAARKFFTELWDACLAAEASNEKAMTRSEREAV